LLSLALVNKSAAVVGGRNNNAPPSLSRTVGRNFGQTTITNKKNNKMIPQFVILHFANKMRISKTQSILRHQELEKFFLKVAEKGTVSPTKLVDETWHNFILHTRLYSEYCQTNFGQFIHHNPHMPTFFGMTPCNGEEETKDCDTAFVPKQFHLALCDSGGDGGGSSCDSQFSPNKIGIE
jgi:hypothetical protein